MRALVALFLAIISVVSAHHNHAHHDDHDYVIKTRDDLITYRNRCVEKLSIPAELVDKYKKWEYPDDEKTHCYMKCMFEEFGFFDEKNGFDVKSIHHQLVGANGGPVDHTDETHAKIERCSAKNAGDDSDACKWAYRSGMCFIRENLKLVQHSVNVDN